MNILVVEDDKELLKLASMGLKYYGYKVLEADSLKETIYLLKRKKIDLVFADVFLIDGVFLDVIPEVFKMNKNVKILFTTAHCDYIDKIKLLKFPYILKPYNAIQVVEKINSILQ